MISKDTKSIINILTNHNKYELTENLRWCVSRVLKREMSKQQAAQALETQCLSPNPCFLPMYCNLGQNHVMFLSLTFFMPTTKIKDP